MKKSSQFLMEESNFGKLIPKATQSSSIQQATLSTVFNILTSIAAIPGCPIASGRF
jgi:hypothetical protein